MKLHSLTMLTLGLSLAAFGQKSKPEVAQQETTASAYIWSDKYVYSPGESLTLRGTVKPNGDATPYVLMAYRVNNQTGAKTYLPGGTDAITDITGRTPAQGFQAAPLPELNKAVVIGEGGLFPAALGRIPEEFGMHTIVLEIRDATGNVVVKRSYWKIGVVRGFEDLPNNITADRFLTNDRAYRVTGIVQVRNATLTIEPGTFIIGQPGSIPPSVLLVTTSGRLVAAGTRSRPIIMTSSQPIGQRQRGDWGGLIMLGRAPINDPGGSLPIEGLPESPETRFGGTNENHDCGILRYVRVEFAGAQLRPNEETNSFTWGGCGKLTTSAYLQAHYGFDDSFEWFGGNNDAKFLVGTYGADDYIDTQIGYTGRIQHVLGLANSELSNRGIEADNYERDFFARPIGRSFMWNMTFVGHGGPRGFDETDASCVYLRRGAAGVYNNILCFNWATQALGIANDDSVVGNIPTGLLSFDGFLAWNNGDNRANDLNGQAAAGWRPYFGGTGAQRARNVMFANPLLCRPLDYSDPDFRPCGANSPILRGNWALPPDDGFFDQWATYIGAFGDVNWTEEWTTFLQEADTRP
jgi:hypothetical protein